MTRFKREIKRENGLALYETENENLVLVSLEGDLYKKLNGFSAFEYAIKGKKMGEFYMLTEITSKKIRDEYRYIPEKYRHVSLIQKRNRQKSDAWYDEHASEIEEEHRLDKLFWDIDDQIKKIERAYRSFEGHYDRYTNSRESISPVVPQDVIERLKSLRDQREKAKAEHTLLQERLDKSRPVLEEGAFTDKELSVIYTVTRMDWYYYDQDEIISKFMQMM